MLTIFGKKKKDDSNVQIDTVTDATRIDANTDLCSNNHSESTCDLAYPDSCNEPAHSTTPSTSDETDEPGTDAETTATRRVIPFGRNLSIENPTVATPRHPDSYRVHLQFNAGEHSRIRPATLHSPK